MKAINALSIPADHHRISQSSHERGIRKERPRESQFTLIGTGCDCDLGLWVQLAAPCRRIGISNGLLETRSALGRAVLVALYTVEGVLGSLDDEWRRVVAKESLAEIDDGLVG